jgi:hypothetical protein
MTPFEEEYSWHQEQDRLNAADDRTDSGIPLHVLHSPPPPDDPLDLAGLTSEQIAAIAQELYRDCNRLRRELDALQGVIR